MEQLDHKKKVTIMIAIMAAMLFASLNQTIITTALPRIISELSGVEYYSWIFTIYMLASTITAALVGKVSDIYGRKPFIIIGILIFSIGSFLAGTAGSVIQLIVYRGVQGFGAGMIMSTSVAAIGDLFSPRERGRWQGMMGGVFGVASVFGPTLGGYIVDHADWHWVFWVFLPVGIIALALIWALFPSTEKRQGEKVDYWGSIFLTAFIVPLLLALSWGGNLYEWNSFQIIALLTGAALSLLAFIMFEYRVPNPLLPLGLFKNNVFTFSNLISFVLGAGMFGALMYMPFFVQGVIGTSATISGYVMMPMTLSLVLASAITGQLMTRTGKYKKLALAGTFITCIGMAALTTMSTDTTNGIAILYMIVVGFGLGVTFPIFTLTVQNAVKDEMLGVATASSQLFRQMGGTVGVAVMGTVMTQRMGQKLSEISAASGGVDVSALPPEVLASIEKLQDPQVLMDPEQLSQIQAAIPASMQDIFTSFVLTLREALSYSLTGVFFTGAVVLVGALVLTFFLKEIPLRSSAKKPAHE